MNRLATILFSAAILLAGGCTNLSSTMNSKFQSYTLDYQTPVDEPLQAQLEKIDATLRAKYGMTTEQTAVGLLDLRSLRLAMVRPDYELYAASVAKLGIMLAYFQLHPEAATNLDPAMRHDLALMVRPSDDAAATRIAQTMGLKAIQQVLDSYHFYDASRGGGIWVGKYYGKVGERYGDPVADNSHAVTVRQALRFYLLLEQRKLVSPAASQTMLDILATPDVPADDIKFVKGLAGRDVKILRKWGSWENWYHDTAIIAGPDRCYVLVGLTQNPRGDEYLVDLAVAVDDLMIQRRK
jgi:beta-lactamase class A